MMDIKLLDCTLRDGGYVNDWEFGQDNIVNIFERLVSAGIDIIEVGFIDERRTFDLNRTIMPDSDAVNRMFSGLDKGESIIVGMIDYGTCSIDHILEQKNSFLDGIRVIFKKQKMYEAIDFCRQIKEKGYKVFAQAVSITSYDDNEFAELLTLINRLAPYAFSLVDTYGLLHKQQLLHYYQTADEHLDSHIGLGYHAHNNFQLAYANCIELFENPPQNRLLIVDGTLYGMGKSAGNAPIELLVTYLNEHGSKHYYSSQLMEAIDVTIMDIYRQIPWGYNFKFFMSASHDCHPNYVSYLMDKQKISVKSVHQILDQIEVDKKLLYDRDYIERLYVEYQKKISGVGIDSGKKWIGDISGRSVLLLGPGPSIYSQRAVICDYIAQHNPVVISVNFLPDDYAVNYVFISNAKRYVQLSTALSRNHNQKLVATSNVTKASGEFEYTLSYSGLLDEAAMIVDNPMVMLIRYLVEHGMDQISLAGFDGYTKSITSDYINPNMEHSFSKEKALELNADTVESLKRIPNLPKLHFVTETHYEL